MTKKYQIFLLTAIIFSILNIKKLPAQVNLRDSVISIPMITASYAIQMPGGDLAKRFGYNSNVGISFQQKIRKNWVIGLDGNFLFGNVIKEKGILDSLATAKGYIIGIDGQYAQIHFYERGYSLALSCGKLIPVWSPNPNSGLLFKGSVGYLQHKIRIENSANTVPQLSKEYLKGYDRLSNGLSVTEFIGYMYLSNRRLVNFFGGVEFTQAFTKNKRYNFDTMSRDNKSRVDLLYSARIGWIIPLYKKAPLDFYYY